MWEKILFGFLAVLITLAVGGYLYYRLAVYQPPAISPEDRAAVDLMPLPAKLHLEKGSLELTGAVQLRFAGHRDALLERAMDRLLQHLEAQGAPSVRLGDSGLALIIDCNSASSGAQQVKEEEGYSLTINDEGIHLKAATAYGVLRGLETLTQMLQEEDGSFFFPYLHIEDAPRFPWRGLMIDVCRYWVPATS